MDMHAQPVAGSTARAAAGTPAKGFGRQLAQHAADWFGSRLGRSRERASHAAAAGSAGPGPASPDADMLCRLDAIPDGGALAVYPRDPKGMPLVVAREGDRVHGWLNVCPQDGGRMECAPGLFRVDAGELQCKRRGAVFTLHDGCCVRGPCRGRALTPVALRLERGRVFPVHTFAAEEPAPHA